MEIRWASRGCYFGAEAGMVQVTSASVEVFVRIVPKRKDGNERDANTDLLYKEMRKKWIQRTWYAVLSVRVSLKN